MPLGRRARPLQHILARPQQLHHRQRKIGEVIRINLFAFAEKIIQSFGVRRFRQLGTQANRQLHNPVPPLRSPHNPPNGSDLLLLQCPRNHAICRNHEVFDQLCCRILMGRLQRDPVVVHLRLALDCLDIQSAMPISFQSQPLRNFIL